jgi:hypothetical protein
VAGVCVEARLHAADGLAEEELGQLADLLPGATTRTARTDEDGIFSIRGLGNGIYAAAALPTTQGEGSSMPSALPTDQVTARRQVRPGSPPVDVWLAEDSLPLDLIVDLRSSDQDRPIDWFHYRLISGQPPGVVSSGVLQRRGGPPRLRVSITRPFQIELGAPGHASRRLVIPAGSRGTRRIEEVLDRGAVIRGQVLDRSDRPAPGAFLQFKDAQGHPVALRAGPDRLPVDSLTVGRSGRFELRGVPSGPLRIETRPLRSPSATPPMVTAIELAPGEVRDLTLHLAS